VLEGTLNTAQSNHAIGRSGSSRQPDPRQKKPDDHMWRDYVEGRVVDDGWQNADDAVRERLR